MAKKQKKKKAKPEAAQVKDFLDMIAPAAVKFNTDSSVLGSSCRCTLALRSYPASTGELALLSHLGEKSGVLLHIYIRQVPAAEEDAILHNAQNKNRMDRSSTSNMKQSITAEANLQDVETLIATMRRNKEPLVHCAVFIELCARDADGLRSLRDDVTAMLTRSKLGADRIFLRQREGFLAVNPAGDNVFGILYERVLPASSAANLFPFNYSGKNDPHGFYIGKDRYGSNIILDLDRRAEDKTNANVLILGNSGQGKSFLLKLLLCNILASGKSVICLDAEHEQDYLCKELNGCFADIMSGQYIINPLEPKLWNEENEDDPEAPAAFRQRTRLSQHISFLKDCMFHRDGVIHCLLALGQGSNDGVLIAAEGYNYPRYASYIPGMRDIVNALLDRAAALIIRDGAEKSMSANWCVSFGELEEQLGLTIREGNGLDSMLRAALKQRPEVAAVDMRNGCIELEYHPEYCRRLKEEELPGLRLKELLPLLKGGPIFLCHEDTEQSVLAENLRLLTGAGQEDHAALLNARVSEINETPEGTEVVLTEVAPEELVRFNEAYDAFMEAEQAMGPTMG